MIKLTWPHVAGAAALALVTGACLYLKIIPDTAGVAILSSLVGLFVPTAYGNMKNDEVSK